MIQLDSFKIVQFRPKNNAQFKRKPFIFRDLHVLCSFHVQYDMNAHLHMCHK